MPGSPEAPGSCAPCPREVRNNVRRELSASWGIICSDTPGMSPQTSYLCGNVFGVGSNMFSKKVGVLGRSSVTLAPPADLASPVGAMLADPDGWDDPADWDAVLPQDEQFSRLVPNPYCGPPDGADAGAVDVPADLLSEYPAAVETAPVPEVLLAGPVPREGGLGAGFAAGGVADDLPPCVALAGLTSDIWTAGLDRITDDELIGVLRAWRRLTSWMVAGELAAVAGLNR